MEAGNAATQQQRGAVSFTHLRPAKTPSFPARWLNSVRTDKRPAQTKSDAERAQGGARISLTFRTIGTFLTADEGRIFGQGAKGKTHAEAGAVVRGGPEAERLLEAFGRENHESKFDWETCYGEGSDVLHFTAHEE